MVSENFVPIIFEHEKFGEVRVVMIDGKPWFVGKDVAVALNYANPRDALAKHVPDKFKRKSQIATPGGVQEMTVINEAGMYKLIMRSKLPKAEEFSDWVCEEVLPSIFRTGSYTLPNVATNLEQSRLEVERLRLTTEQARLELERDRLNLEREQFAVANNDETKIFAKAQLLRELASASGDNQLMRSKFLRQAAMLVGEDLDIKKSDDIIPKF